MTRMRKVELLNLDKNTDVVVKAAQAIDKSQELLLFGGLPALIGGGIALSQSDKRNALDRFLDAGRGAGAGAMVGIGAGAGGYLGDWAGQGIGDNAHASFSTNAADPEARAKAILMSQLTGRLGGAVGGGVGGYVLAKKMGLIDDETTMREYYMDQFR